MRRLHTLVLAAFLAAAAGAADPKGGGWRPLFKGTNLAGWTSAAASNQARAGSSRTAPLSGRSRPVTSGPGTASGTSSST
jgi:hypothetical protein